VNIRALDRVFEAFRNYVLGRCLHGIGFYLTYSCLSRRWRFCLRLRVGLVLDVNLERSAKHDYEECCGSGSSRICIILPDRIRMWITTVLLPFRIRIGIQKEIQIQFGIKTMPIHNTDSENKILNNLLGAYYSWSNVDAMLPYRQSWTREKSWHKI